GRWWGGENPSSGLSATFSHKGRRRRGTISPSICTELAAPSPSPLAGEGGRRPDEGLGRKAGCSVHVPLLRGPQRLRALPLQHRGAGGAGFVEAAGGAGGEERTPHPAFGHLLPQGEKASR